MAVEGELWAWGQNEYGQLGIGCSKQGVLEDEFRPTKVSPFVSGGKSESARAAQAACGTTFSVVVDARGSVWTWGAAGDVCLGHGISGSLTGVGSKSTIVSTSDLMTARVLHKRSLSTSRIGANIVASDVRKPWWAVPSKVYAVQGVHRTCVFAARHVIEAVLPAQCRNGASPRPSPLLCSQVFAFRRRQLGSGTQRSCRTKATYFFSETAW